MQALINKDRFILSFVKFNKENKHNFLSFKPGVLLNSKTTVLVSTLEVLWTH